MNMGSWNIMIGVVGIILFLLLWAFWKEKKYKEEQKKKENEEMLKKKKELMSSPISIIRLQELTKDYSYVFESIIGIEKGFYPIDYGYCFSDRYFFIGWKLGDIVPSVLKLKNNLVFGESEMGTVKELDKRLEISVQKFIQSLVEKIEKAVKKHENNIQEIASKEQAVA